MKEGAPIRFLILLLGGWTCFRLAVLAPGWWTPDAVAAGGMEEARRTLATRLELVEGAKAPPRWSTEPVRIRPPALRRMALRVPAQPLRFGIVVLPQTTLPPVPPRTLPRVENESPFLLPAVRPSLRPLGRWTGSVWLLARENGGVGLARGGTTGGGQAGARLLYRLNRNADRPLALSGRLYLPLHRTAGAEGAFGLDWRPVSRLPVHVLIERRQRLGREGRSALAIAAYGGGSLALAGGWRLDGYGQAGVIGARSRDAFIDGTARVSRAIGPVEAGAALWGAAQPGAARLDAGPHLSLPVRAAGASLRLSAEYRFRVAGDTRPASGPALTLGADF